MADSTKTKSGGGCLGKLLVLILMMLATGIGLALFFMSQAQDLTKLGGYGPVPKGTPEPEMKVVLQNALDRGYAVTLTEAEINRWLGRTLVAKQGGLLAKQVSFGRVWVRLEEGRAEVVMERKIMDKPFTISMYFQVEQTQGPKGVNTEVRRHGGPYLEWLPKPPTGGRFGQLVVPQGFMHLVVSSFDQLGDCLHEELQLAFEEMARIKIEKGRLILDPKDPSSDLSPTF